nr:MAG TPA: tail protein [Caudoviricetes sp.]
MAVLLARGQITIAAIRDGKDGAQGEKGEKGDAGFNFANGKSMYKDLLFDDGYNGCSVYNNLANGNVKLSIVSKSSDNPYSIANKELKIETTGAATPGHGGLVQRIMSRANAVFVRRVIAKIPKGYTLNNAENAMGTNFVSKWLTPKVGTGVFTEYMYMYQCGASGSFSSGGFMHLYGGATATADKPVVWYIASCETYDMTAGSSAQIKSTEVMYATSTSGTSAPTSGWQKNIPTVASGSFLWSRFTVTYMDGSNAVSYNVSKMGDRGPQGATGAAGKDAVSASFSPAALTFSAKTDGNGNCLADVSSGNTATITMLEGSSKVTGTYSITSNVGCTATISGSTVTVKSVAHDNIDGRAISRTSASVTVKCVYNSKMCYVDLPISVSVSAVWGGLVTSQKGLESKYNEVSNKYNALPLKTQGELTRYTSSIKQSARNISLKVGETVVGRHNLLTGSAFERKTDFWLGNDSYMPYISVLNNYKGYNSAVIEGKSGTNRGVDFIRVKVNAARKNVVSAMLKCSGTVSDGDFNVYILQRDGSMVELNKNLFIPLSVAKNMIANEWMLAAETLTLDANTAYIDCVFLYYGTKTAYIACPQIAEGEEYSGYTLSEQDRGYIGGNLLINTDTLVKPDTLSIYNSDPLVVDSTHTSLLQKGDANKYGSYATLYTDATSAEVNTIRWNLKGMNLIKQGQMYMLSFVAKGTGKVCAFLYNDGTPLVSTEASGFTSSNQSADGNALITLTSSWQRYFVFWRIVGDKLPIYVLFRAMKGSKLYLSQPKLEYGATVTEWRAEKTDYIEDKSIAGSLLDAGIDITSRQIMLTADKTMFRTTKGINVAVFDESGINAQLVRAQRLQTKGKNGIEVRIEDGMVQIFGAAGVANIRFGLDDNGYATLGYYDNHGNLLYDLGPKGIAKLDVSDSTMTRVAFIDLDAAGLVSPYTEKKDGYLWITADNNNKFFGLQGKPNVYVRVNLGVSKSVTLYLYRAPRVNGEVMADDKYGMNKSQTEKADGCYFTSSKIQVVGNNFTNLAKGTYLPWDAQTRDNTKFRPIGVKSVPKLSVGGYMTLSTSALASTSQLKILSTVYGGGVYVFPDDGFGKVEID